MRAVLRMGVAATLLASTVLIAAPGALAQTANAAKPFLHPLFTDNMVLQRGVADPIWGWAEPGQKVTVSMSGAAETATKTERFAVKSSVTAGADGKWLAKIGPLKAGGPYSLMVSGPQDVTLNNVMVGDVWICSGQSNMEMGIGAINAPDDIAKANNPNIRLFTVPKAVAMTPRDLTSGQWDVCTPETVAKGGWGGFSAVGYFFGKNLQENLKVPIGLIHTSWGGTIAEAWTSAEALKANLPEFVPAVEQVEAAAKNQNAATFAQQMADWWTKNDPGTAANWQNADIDVAAWKTMNLPAKWEDAGLPDFDGVAWIRKEVAIPDAWAGKDLTLHLGPIDDNDSTFFNGTQVGSTEGWQAPRDYKIPGNLVKAGKNIIAVRVLDTGGGGGAYGNAADMKLEAPGAEPIALAGAWSFKDSVPLNKTAPAPAQINGNPNVTTVLYNGMIAPLVPFGVKGAIWYQGESNAGRGKQYQTLLPTMIKDWRNRFGVGEFPFYIVQLANFMEAKDQPGESAWAELREAQSLTSQTLPNTGIAVAIDIGDAADIHPRNKQEVGRRLALNALAKDYGQKIEYSGPLYDSMKTEGGKIRLKFTHAAGLAAKKMPAHDPAKAVDLPRGHWAYKALDKLAEVGIIEGKPDGTAFGNIGNKVVARYEFAVAIARLLQKNQLQPERNSGPLGTTIKAPLISEEKASLIQIVSALRQEFLPELVQLGMDKSVGNLSGFAIAGDDKKWFWANAKIEGDEVVLWNEAVFNPTVARYNWADNPNGNLTNAAGLPAVPFRTDRPQ